MVYDYIRVCTGWGNSDAKAYTWGVALVALMTGGATAADFPVAALGPPPVVAPMNWQGFYIGASVGAHFGEDRLSSTTTSGFLISPVLAAAIDGAFRGNLQERGAVATLQGGYNWQFGSTVLGIELDANGLAAKSSRTLTFLGGNNMVSKVDGYGLATIRPRVGYVWGPALLYVTGGYASAVVRTTDSFSGFGGTLTLSTSPKTHVSGWTVGTGVEYGFAPSWSAKFEYLYVDLRGFQTSVAFSPSDVIAFNHKLTDNIVRAGVNYRFGW
jgi:outer membrane immunogenic protein